MGPFGNAEVLIMAVVALLFLVGASLAGLVGLSGPEDDAAFAGPDDGMTGDDLLIDGTAGPDTLQGGVGGDLVVGRAGNDLLSGGAGNDWLLGLDGDDVLQGGPGNDVLIGGDGSDRISGGAGDDFVEAANIIDQDALVASLDGLRSFADIAFAYALPGLSDQGDLVDLGAGDDTIVAGSDDTVTGGDGADEFALGDWIDGGRPVLIEDFDLAEDLITFVSADDRSTPDLTIERDAVTGLTTLKADGQAVAVIRNASPDFSLRNVAVGRYAA